MTVKQKIMASRGPAALACLASLLAYLAASIPRETILGLDRIVVGPPSRTELLLMGAAAVTVLIAIYLVFVSRARFFIAAATIVAGVVGPLVFDTFNIRIPLPNGTVLSAEASRFSDWRVHLGLLVLAGGLFLLDHLRRPPAGKAGSIFSKEQAQPRR